MRVHIGAKSSEYLVRLKVTNDAMKYELVSALITLAPIGMTVLQCASKSLRDDIRQYNMIHNSGSSIWRGYQLRCDESLEGEKGRRVEGCVLDLELEILGVYSKSKHNAVPAAIRFRR